MSFGTALHFPRGDGIEHPVDQRAEDNEQLPVVHALLQRRTVIAAAVVILTIGILVAASRGTASVWFSISSASGSLRDSTACGCD
jgi:hypothetical protein